MGKTVVIVEEEETIFDPASVVVPKDAFTNVIAEKGYAEPSRAFAPANFPVGLFAGAALGVIFLALVAAAVVNAGRDPVPACKDVPAWNEGVPCR